jgi:mannose-1-phosphate guanylyltransferase/mannose-1-phosphate guanylyltransferase/mannose-6-phosphate isomerase
LRKIHPVLLSGGAGSRLWPLSREALPKQFLPLVSDRSLFQEAALRVADPLLFAPTRVIASASHRFLVAQQLQEIGVAASAIVLEPSARSTTAAAAVAALLVEESDPGGLVLLVPADHRIVDVAAFHAAVRIAAETASSGFLSLFGITPDRPATGYGYIHAGEPIAAAAGARHVAAFVEKPDRATAEGYLRGGDYLWNSGIFLLPATVFLAELSRFEPELLANARKALQRALHDEDFIRLDQEAFGRCRSIAVDLAVMERSDRMAVIPVDCGWTDVGSWSTLADMAERDAPGNTIAGEVLIEATRTSYIRTSGPLVATVGVEDLIVVATPDAVLVAHKDHDQDIKRIVDRLRDGKHGRI